MGNHARYAGVDPLPALEAQDVAGGLGVLPHPAFTLRTGIREGGVLPGIRSVDRSRVGVQPAHGAAREG